MIHAKRKEKGEKQLLFDFLMHQAKDVVLGATKRPAIGAIEKSSIHVKHSYQVGLGVRC